MKVIFTGAHGTGKTTVLNMFKDKGYPVITEVVRNLVKNEGIKINEQGSEETQKMIFKEYLKIFNERENYISDRGLIDVTAYSYVLGESLEDVFWQQAQTIGEWFENNPDVKVVYFPIEFEIIDDGVRSTDKKFQQDVDYAIRSLLGKLDIDFLEVTGSPTERMSQILDYIK